MEIEYDRVTDILTQFSGIEFVNQDILTEAASRGTLVHKFIEEYFSGGS